jgi:serine/threonine protein kinase
MEMGLPTELAGRYSLLAPMGQGATATVYRAMDRRLSVERAIKVLHNKAEEVSAEVRARMASEARAMALIDHPGVVRVFDVGLEGGHDYVVMELIDGGTLAQRLATSGPFRMGELRRVAIELLDVLAAAHAAGIIHRDIKPQNLLLDRLGHVRLADFGIALLTRDEGRVTRTGMFMGSMAYMAPEQRLDARLVGVGADIYGVGSTLFHLYTGQSPIDLFVAEEARWRAIPAALVAILQRATRPRPEDRFPSAQAMREAVEAIEVDGHVSGPVSRPLPQLAAQVSETLPVQPSPSAPASVKASAPLRLRLRPALANPKVDFAVGFGIIIGLAYLLSRPIDAPLAPAAAAPSAPLPP